MLKESKITAFVPTTQPEKAKQFYQEILGLELVSEDGYAMEFKGNGACLRVTKVQELVPQPFTVLGFRINGIESQIRTLIENGIRFEQYQHFEQSILGIWNSPSGARVAWFKDPDGNLLSLTQYP